MMRTKTKILAWTGGITTCCALLYAASPALLAVGISRQLAAHGLEKIQVRTGYPGWTSTRIPLLRFDAYFAGQKFACEIRNTRIEYTPGQLLQRRLARVQIPDIDIRFHPEPGIRSASPKNIAPPLAALLPGQWLARLPAHEILLENIHAERKTPDGRQFFARISGHLRPAEAYLQGYLQDKSPGRETSQVLGRFVASIRKNNQAQLRISMDKKPSILQASVDTVPTREGELEISGKLETDLDLLTGFLNSIAPLPAILSGMNGKFLGTWKTRIDPGKPFVPATFLQSLRIESETRLYARVDSIDRYTGITQASLASRFLLEKGILHWDILPQSRMSSLVSLPGDNNKIAPHTVKLQVPEKIHGQARMTDRAIHIQIHPGKLFSIEPLQVKSLVLPRTIIGLEKSAQWSYTPGTGNWDITSTTLKINASPLSWKDYQLGHNGLQLRISGAGAGGNRMKWQGKGEIQAGDIKAVVAQHALSPGQLFAQFNITGHALDLSTKFTAASGAFNIDSTIHHAFDSGSGSVRLILQPVPFRETGLHLGKLFLKWPYPFEVSSGQISGTASASWQTANPDRKSKPVFSSQKLELVLNDIGGKWNEIVFSGLGNRISLAYDGKLRTLKDSRLHLKQAQVGFPVQDLDAVFSLPAQAFTLKPVIRVKSLNAKLLGGIARSDPFSFDLASKRNSVPVHLENIGLKEIMALEKQEGLSGTGVLDGMIPIEFTGKGIEVKNGKLGARSPGGIIRYLPNERVAALAQSNASIRMLTGALSNFQYENLDIHADYAPDGTLAMKVALKGKNPEWQSGRPVHVNLNLEENIPVLLKSLRLGRDIEEQARKGYQKKR